MSDLLEPDVPPDAEEEVPVDDARRPVANEDGPDVSDLGLTPPD